jgi:Putative Ig domain
VNVAPVLDTIGNQSVDELATLTFTATADDADEPANTLAFSLDATSIAAGMSINASTGEFSWTPTEPQGPHTYSVTITVTDNGTNPDNLTDSETITITVNEVNVAPVLDTIGNQSVDELATLTFTATATDADVPANTLTFTLDATSIAAGMSINASTGVFSWTPTEAQGPGSYTMTVTVTDNGTNPNNLTDSETITITVNEVNVAPILTAIGNKSVLLGNTLTFGVSATDADIPLNTLAFSLDAGAPTGTSITTNTSTSPAAGTFAWTPTPAQTGLSSITVRVSDNGSPVLSDSETIQVLVKYGVCFQYDPTKSHKKGSTIPLKIALCDASGNNVSSEAVVVQAISIVKVDSLSSPIVAEDSGSANPDNNFRFAGGFYIYNLSLKSPGFGTGTWKMSFTVNGVSDPSYVLLFDVK